MRKRPILTGLTALTFKTKRLKSFIPESNALAVQHVLYVCLKRPKPDKLSSKLFVLGG
jgi:hypothetical protein